MIAKKPKTFKLDTERFLNNKCPYGIYGSITGRYVEDGEKVGPGLHNPKFAVAWHDVTPLFSAIVALVSRIMSFQKSSGNQRSNSNGNGISDALDRRVVASQRHNHNDYPQGKPSGEGSSGSSTRLALINQRTSSKAGSGAGQTGFTPTKSHSDGRSSDIYGSGSKVPHQGSHNRRTGTKRK